jgi:hypothetical protein
MTAVNKLDHVTQNSVHQCGIIIGLACETLVFAGGILLDLDLKPVLF